MEPAAVAELSRQTADAILAELNKISDLTARATALRALTTRFGGLAVVEVETWAKEGGNALRDGLALTLSRMMTQAEASPAMGAAWDAIAGSVTGAVGGIGRGVGGRVGAGISSAAGIADAAISAVSQITAVVGAGRAADRQRAAASTLVAAAQKTAQADAIIAASQRQAAATAAPRPAVRQPLPQTFRPMQRLPEAATAPAQAQQASVQPQALTAPSSLPAWATTPVIVGAVAVPVVGLLAFLLLRR